MDNNFEAFMRIRGKVANRVLRMVQSREDAEDTMQELAIKILQNQSVINASTIDAWIFTVARNIARDKSDKNARYYSNCISITILDEENGDERIRYSNDISTELKIENKEIQKLLRMCLQQLPEEDRNLILYHCVEDLTYVDIAEKLGKSVNTVKSKARRALKKLHKALIINGYLDKNV
jgi:RNA polymerase sigma factor (sigma-70 family)